MKTILEIRAKIVFMRMANCVPRVLETATHSALKKGRQICKPQSSTEVLVEVLLNACAAEFKAELQVMFVDFPGEAVNELIVGVHAVPRIGGIRSGLGEKRTTP